MSTFSVIETVVSRTTKLVCVATAFLVSGAALESTASAQAVYNGITNCYDDPTGIAPPVCPNANGGNSRSRPVPTVDPCFIAQNAMRPCKPKPVGVDPAIVGKWELPKKGGPWVWEIARNGTYKSYSEAGDGVTPHQGTFAASKGNWALKSTSGMTHSGAYKILSSDSWLEIGNGQTAEWHLDSPKASSSKPAPPVPAKSQSPGLRSR